MTIGVVRSGFCIRDGALCYEKVGYHDQPVPYPVGLPVIGTRYRVAESTLIHVTLRMTLLRVWPSRRWLFKRAVRRWCRLCREHRTLVDTIMRLQEAVFAEIAIAGRKNERSREYAHKLNRIMPRYRRLDDYIRNAFIRRLRRKQARMR